MEAYLAQILMFAGNFAPRGWALCNGQLLSISANQALFSILGTTYGGDGRTTFALPDLRGRGPIHAGTGPGLRTYRLGARSGTEYNVLSTNSMPSHNHTAVGKLKVAASGTVQDPTGNYPATATGRVTSGAGAGGGIQVNGWSTPATGLAASEGVSVNVENNGGGQKINDMQPYIAINYIIATVGLFPPRS